MSCGKAYMDLVVTSGGLTPTNQYGLYPGPFDYNEWQTLASNLLIRTKLHLDRLQAATSGEEDTVKSNAFAEQYNALAGRYEELPSKFFSTIHEMDTIRALGLTSTLSVETVCLMEAIDVELDKAGMVPPTEGARKAAVDPQGFALNLGALAVLGFAGYLFWKSS